LLGHSGAHHGGGERESDGRLRGLSAPRAARSSPWTSPRTGSSARWTEIRLSGAKAHAQCADALDPKQVGRVVEETVGEFGRIDILVNAVGGSTIIERPAQALSRLG